MCVEEELFGYLRTANHWDILTEEEEEIINNHILPAIEDERLQQIQIREWEDPIIEIIEEAIEAVHRYHWYREAEGIHYCPELECINSCPICWELEEEEYYWELSQPDPEYFGIYL